MPGAFTFPRAARLTTPEEFKRVFAAPTRSTDAYFTVLARRNEGETARLGLAIAKRNSRRAVDRHRLKRLVRDSFRLSQQQLKGLDIVVLSQRRATGSPNAVLHRSLQAHWSNLLDQ